jgi:colanic acid/amylovoran biosynthesis glycosyltransferase
VPTVAVYRWSVLAPSETFIRNQALALRRWSAVFVGEQRRQGLELPRGRVELATPGRRPERVVRRRVLRRDGFERLVARCRERRVALVHAHFGPDGLSGLRLSRVLGVPLVVTFHGYDAMIHDAALEAAGGSLAEFLHGRAELFAESAMLVAVSGAVADELISRGAPAAKVRVHHIGVPVGLPPERSERERTVLFVGRHVEKKGLGDLIDAMGLVLREIPDARLLVIGDGPLRAGFEARARALGGAVRFAGWLGPAAIRREMERAGVLCVPSRRGSDGDAEGLPMVICEAGERGLPVVATRHSGIPEIVVDGRTGLLAEEGDVAGLARRLVMVLGDPGLGRRMGAAARGTVERDFDVARQSALLDGLYDEAIGDGRR